MQYVQNLAGRILTGTLILESLYWLTVRLMLTCKALNVLAPCYLSALLIPYASNQRLRSSHCNLLAVPQTILRSMGVRAFSLYAPTVWNSLPPEFRGAQTSRHTFWNEHLLDYFIILFIALCIAYFVYSALRSCFKGAI